MESIYLWSFGERLSEHKRIGAGERERTTRWWSEWSVPKQKENTVQNQYIEA